MHISHLHTQSAARALAVAIMLSLALAVLTGCQPRTGVQPAPTQSERLMSTADLQAEADKAWNERRFSQAELYYQRLLERTDLSDARRLTAYGRLAESAYEAGHYRQAMMALDAWAGASYGVQDSWEWNELYLKTLNAMQSTDKLEAHLRRLLSRDDMAWSTKFRTAVWYARVHAHDDASGAMDLLAKYYEAAPDDEARAVYEAETAAMLTDLDDTRLRQLADTVLPSDAYRFPYNLVVAERAVRHAHRTDEWPAAWGALRDVVSHGGLADPARLELKIADLEMRYGIPRLGVALALPLTGRYGQVGWKIARGIGAAQWTLSQQGMDVDVKIVNTDAPDWLEQMRNLPGHFAIVGGPVRVNAYKKLQQSGAARGRALFAFLPSLGDSVEGRDAWRFFSSPVDQVRSMVELTAWDMGISDFAVLYPEENFGRRMAQLFRQVVDEQGAEVVAATSYPPGAHTQWGRRVASLLDVPASFSENKDEPLPEPRFGAVFIPDGWSQAQLLVPNFIFYEADSVVLLGPDLWSRALDAGRDVEESYFRLAVCPGSWWDDSEGAQALGEVLASEGLGAPDFWVALGYDFLRLSSRVGMLPAGFAPEELNSRLQQASDMRFSMAPLSWDEEGLVSQELYLFNPSRNGKALVNGDLLEKRRARALKRREKRVETWETKQEEARAAEENDPLMQ